VRGAARRGALTLRLFFAIELDEAARAALAAAVEHARHAPGLPHGLRWLAQESWHFTLQFLGEVEPARVEDLAAAGLAAARAHAPFELSFGPPSSFGSPRRARLVYLGLARGQAPMSALATSLHAWTAALGMPAEKRAFVPHVTLARLRQPGDLRPALGALRAPPESMRVQHLTLLRSRLSQTGARYEPLSRAALGPAS